MLLKNSIRISVIIIISLFLYSCPPPPELPGDIIGIVKDCETSEPLAGASIKVVRSAETYGIANTRDDGTFTVENVPPDEEVYEVQASKIAYSTNSENIKVFSAQTSEVIICLPGIPLPEFSASYLDFGTVLSSHPFTISNIGRGKLYYMVNSDQDWVTINPNSGDLTDETDTIRVSINRTVLDDNMTYKHHIIITSSGGPTPIQNTIGIYVNGLMDLRDSTYYKVVKIGSQTWLGENLNIGNKIAPITLQENNNLIEKYCFNGKDSNCNIYGGYYQWNEAMQYNPSDTGLIGSTRGICPDGWHIPTEKEWWTLVQNLGGSDVAGGKLKETGTQHWSSPNKDATNESGFTAFGNGLNDCRYEQGPGWWNKNEWGVFWSSTCSVPWELYDWMNNAGVYFKLTYDTGEITSEKSTLMSNICTNIAVRCIKDL